MDGEEAVAEILRLSNALLAGQIDADAVLADVRLTDQQRAEVFCVAIYEMRRRHARNWPPQRRGYRLLRTLLSDVQRSELRRRRRVTVTGSHGGRYRLFPVSGAIERIERHGCHEYIAASLCLHSPHQIVPPVDETIAHLLLLASDEPSLLAAANQSERRHGGWDGAWQRRRQAIRLATEAIA